MKEDHQEINTNCKITVYFHIFGLIYSVYVARTLYGYATGVIAFIFVTDDNF